MSVDHEPSAAVDPVAQRPDPDTLEQRVFVARLEARMLGTSPELPRIGRFVLERMLGAGGMGTVWLARDDTLGRSVALKLVKGSNASASERMREREARALAQISHPNVITVFDFGEHEGRVWLAMEHVPGRTLRECAGEQDPKQTLAHWIAAGHGLAAIHAAGLVHRDVKPDNVLLGDDGRIRLIDLGLARVAAERGASPRIGPGSGEGVAALMTPGFVGTRSYAAPEQLRGEGVDARADQYSFCVSVLEGLRAARPTAATGEVEDALLPAHVREALARGRHPDPEQRFSSMNELLAELGPRATGQRAPGRTLALVGALVLGAGILGVGLVGSGSGGGDAPPAELGVAPPSPAWSACMARAAPACDGQRSEVVELVITCADPRCESLDVNPTSAVLAGERLPFDVDIDNRTPRAAALRWYAAHEPSRAGEAKLGPGRRPLPPHWGREDVPICVEVVDAGGQVKAVAITSVEDCDSLGGPPL